MTSMPDDYQIPDDPEAGRMDAAFLRTCLGIRSVPAENPPELPMAVRRAHYGVSRTLSVLGRKGGTMDETQLAMVIEFAKQNGVEVSEPAPPAYSFMPEVEAGRVEVGQKLVIHWRNKDRASHFVQRDGDRLILLHDGHERSIRPDLVRYPKDGEFSEVADNINAVATGS